MNSVRDFASQVGGNDISNGVNSVSPLNKNDAYRRGKYLKSGIGKRNLEID